MATTARIPFRPLRLLVTWLLSAAALLLAALIVPGVEIAGFGAALLVALVIAALNAIVPPLLAALRLPYTVLLGFLLVLAADAAMLLLADALVPHAISVSSFGWALLAALVTSAASTALDTIVGIDDDDVYVLRVTRRIARRTGGQEVTDVPGIVFLEIDGLALPVLRRAMRDGNAPELARWAAEGTHRLLEWETDTSSQTGASQAGILLGSNEDVPAFRWVEKESGRLMTCSAPADCAELERRLGTERGLLTNGGASRGNLLSGGADQMILTVSRMDEERRANPGYRAFLASGFNVTRSLVLFTWEVVLELVAAARQRRRDVLPRGHRGGIYPFLRATLCVVVRDLIVFGVLSDMMKGRPAIYATFSSYDEVAHHSGLERADTLEALRKLDEQLGRIARARRFAPRPYAIVVLSDHGQTQGATFRQRNGYGLDQLVRRHLSGDRRVADVDAGDENDAAAQHALGEATGHPRREPATRSVEGDAVVLASGNLGLVYLLEQQHRLPQEEIEKRHPGLIDALRTHPHVGFLLVRSERDGPIVLGGAGRHELLSGQVVGTDPLAQFSPNAAAHLLRSDGFAHAPDILVNSFYDPQLDEGCAFEELISFHGGLGGPQTRPFVFHPVELPVPDEPLVGAAAVHDLLAGWRAALQDGDAGSLSRFVPPREWAPRGRSPHPARS